MGLGKHGRRLVAAGAIAAVVLGGCRWQSQLVSGGSDAGTSGNGQSFDPVFSPDGTKIAFESIASDLVDSDTNDNYDLFVRDLDTGVTTLVSANAAGTDTANGASLDPVFSPDGTKIAFESFANDLGPTDSNSTLSDDRDVYVRDLTTGAVTLVSHNAAGSDAANGPSSDPVFSPDGTKIAFVSVGTDFGPPVSRFPFMFTDIYMRDLTTDAITLVSANADRTDGSDNGASSPVFSPDGTRIAFTSGSANLVPNVTIRWTDIFLYDIDDATTSLVSVDAAGTGGGDNWSLHPRFSSDGNRIAFLSAASNLGPTDTSICAGDGYGAPCSDIYVRDLVSGAIVLASVNSEGTDSGNGDSGDGGWDFSPDGTAIVFTSEATDLGPTSMPGVQVFLRDLEAGTTSLVSVGSEGGPATGRSWGPVFSPDGDKIAFLSTAGDFGRRDTNGVADLYQRDLRIGFTSLVSANAEGDDSANGPVRSRAVYGPDDAHIAYVTAASDHGGVDTNGVDDVYVAGRSGPVASPARPQRPPAGDRARRRRRAAAPHGPRSVGSMSDGGWVSRSSSRRT